MWQGRRERPQRRFSLHTHLGIAELRGAGQEHWAEPADTHWLAAANSSLSAPGHTETRVSRLSDRWRDRAQAVWCPPEPLFSWLLDSLLSPILGGGEKEDAIYNSTKAIYFEP